MCAGQEADTCSDECCVQRHGGPDDPQDGPPSGPTCSANEHVVQTAGLGSCVACPAGKFRDAGDFETSSVTQCCIDPERPCLTDDGPQADIGVAIGLVFGLFGAMFSLAGLCIHGTCSNTQRYRELLKETGQVATARILSKRFQVSTGENSTTTTYFVDYIFEGTAANGQPFRLAAKDDTSIPPNVWKALPETPTLQATFVQLEVTFLAEEPEHCLLTAQITEGGSAGCCGKTFVHIFTVAGFCVGIVAPVAAEQDTGGLVRGCRAAGAGAR